MQKEYVSYRLKPKELIALTREKIKEAKHIICEKLDCKVDFRRVSTDKTVDEILSYVEHSSFNHCTERDYEFCLNTEKDGIHYFIWVS